MKLLLVGNHTCGNRGDGAILRGLIEGFRAQDPNIKIDAITRYPESSSFLIGENLTLDELHAYHGKINSKLDSYWKSKSRSVLPHYLHQVLLGHSDRFLPEHIKKHISELSQYDAVIQVGGSFFVDLYGVSQFEHALCALIANKPLYLLGHSVGPFQSKYFNKIADTVFSRANILSLREDVSLDVMKLASLPTNKVSAGADTAWLVPVVEFDVASHLTQLIAKKPTIAFTLRELAPFDKRLGISQEDYEIAFAKFADQLIDKGYQVIVFSTCTGIESYHKDDRIIGLKVAKKVNNQKDFHVVMDELNDVELGVLLSKCQLTIGTRLHSAIISMNFNTPAIALNYEHKSKGIMAQLAMPEYSKDVHSLFDGTLYKSAVYVLENLESEKLNVAEKVSFERERASKMIIATLSDIKG